MNSLKELDKAELTLIDGGIRLDPRAVAGYVASEILTGIYEGLKRAYQNECDVECPSW